MVLDLKEIGPLTWEDDLDGDVCSTPIKFDTSRPPAGAVPG